MRIPTPAGRPEKEFVEQALARLRAEWGLAPRFGWRDLLRRWQHEVEALENGYELGIDSFTQALALRDEIDTIVCSAPARLSAATRQWLHPLDARFESSTQPVPQPLLPPEPGAPQHTRWLRIPLKLASVDPTVAETWAEYSELIVHSVA